MAIHYVVDPRRLCDAADALLEAIDSDAGMDALMDMRIQDPYAKETLLGQVFSQYELIEAMDLLIRLGLVNARSPTS